MTKNKQQNGRQRKNIQMIQVSKAKTEDKSGTYKIHEEPRSVTARNQNAVNTGEQEKGRVLRQKEVEG